MWKRTMASILIGLSLIGFSTFAHTEPIKITAKSNAIVDTNRYEIITPEKSTHSTEDKNFLLNGKAPSGSEIKIEVYGTTDLTKRSFNLTKLPQEKDYIQVFDESITSGNMGFFQKQLELVMGINKIIIKFENKDLMPIEMIVYVYDKTIVQGALNNTKDVKISDLIIMTK